jgi:hypothetical protein
LEKYDKNKDEKGQREIEVKKGKIEAKGVKNNGQKDVRGVITVCSSLEGRTFPKREEGGWYGIGFRLWRACELQLERR